jgi:hypothetical protein
LAEPNFHATSENAWLWGRECSENRYLDTQYSYAILLRRHALTPYGLRNRRQIDNGIFEKSRSQTSVYYIRDYGVRRREMGYMNMKIASNL